MLGYKADQIIAFKQNNRNKANLLRDDFSLVASGSFGGNYRQ